MPNIHYCFSTLSFENKHWMLFLFFLFYFFTCYSKLPCGLYNWCTLKHVKSLSDCSTFSEMLPTKNVPFFHQTWRLAGKKCNVFSQKTFCNLPSSLSPTPVSTCFLLLQHQGHRKMECVSDSFSFPLFYIWHQKAFYLRLFLGSFEIQMQSDFNPNCRFCKCTLVVSI